MKYPLTIIAITLLSLTACDNKPNSPPAPSTKPHQAEQTFVDATPTSPTPVAQSTNPQAIDCQAITNTLNAIDINSQIDDFDQADKLLNHCLPTADCRQHHPNQVGDTVSACLSAFFILLARRHIFA